MKLVTHKSFNYLILILTLVTGALLSEGAQANRIQSAYFNNQSERIFLDLVFMGGNKAHEFEIQWDSCVEGPSSLNNDLQGATPSETHSVKLVKQMAGRLVDTSGWDDTGTQELQASLVFPLGDPNCRPAEITILSDRNSRVTLQIP